MRVLEFDRYRTEHMEHVTKKILTESEFFFGFSRECVRLSLSVKASANEGKMQTSAHSISKVMSYSTSPLYK